MTKRNTVQRRAICQGRGDFTAKVVVGEVEELQTVNKEGGIWPKKLFPERSR